MGSALCHHVAAAALDGIPVAWGKGEEQVGGSSSGVEGRKHSASLELQIKKGEREKSIQKNN